MHQRARICVAGFGVWLLLQLALAQPLLTTQPNLLWSNQAEIINRILTVRSKLGQFSGSVLVAKEGRVILSRGYGFADRTKQISNTPTTRFRLASVSKQFTAMGILVLQHQGKLDVQDSVCKYVDNCPAAWQSITLHHLLTHTSGLVRDYGPGVFFDWERPLSPQQLINQVRGLPLNFSPGTRWEYSNVGFDLAGYILERVSGLSYGEFMRQNIFAPLGMVNSGFEHGRGDVAVGYVDKTDRTAPFISAQLAYAAGGLYSTTEDMLKWDQALLSSKLVPEALTKLMLTNHASNLLGQVGYGYGIGVEQQIGRLLYGHGGAIPGFRTYNLIAPKEQVVVIVLANQDNADPYSIAQLIAQEIFTSEPSASSQP